MACSGATGVRMNRQKRKNATWVTRNVLLGTLRDLIITSIRSLQRLHHANFSNNLKSTRGGCEFQRHLYETFSKYGTECMYNVPLK